MATSQQKSPEVNKLTSHSLYKIVLKSIIQLLRAYQFVISPLLGANCRFYPSCSSYTIQAIETHGLIKGSILSLMRIGKCHPWHPGGIDEVPEKTSNKEHQATCCKPHKPEFKHHG